MRTTELNERQRRNRRWLASHPGAVAGISGLLFGLIGAGYGALMADDVSWLDAPVGAVVGAVFGTAVGYGFSLSSRKGKPTGARRVLYLAILVFAFAVVLGMKYLRHTT